MPQMSGDDRFLQLLSESAISGDGQEIFIEYTEFLGHNVIITPWGGGGKGVKGGKCLKSSSVTL